MVFVDKPRKRISLVENRKNIIINENVNYDSDNAQIIKGPRFGCRHVQAILLCFGLISGMSTRANLSVAIVAMTNSSTTPNPDVPHYEWKNTSIILSSFYWSYITFQILAGYLGKTYGPKYFLLATSFLNNCACAATPAATALIGFNGVILCRVVQGFTQGFLYPSIHVMLGTWAPDDERTAISNLVFSGAGIGTILSTLGTGYISASWYGWPYAFYILSFCGFIWCILWLVFGQNSPAVHPRITPEEKKYIQSSLKQEDDIHLPVPWKKICTCVPFYALLVAYVGSTWGYVILMTEGPTFLANVMEFDVKSTAVINSLPTVCGLVMTFITGYLADFVIQKKYVNTLNCRKICNSIGCYGQAFCLLWLSFLTKKEANQSIIALTLGGVLSPFIMVGNNVNHLDLSPRFSGVIFGLLNAVGQGASIIATLLVQLFVPDITDRKQWRTIFLITVGLYGIGATVFIWLASATRQEWDGPESKDANERKKKISVFSLTSMI
ncbi:putative inorganic phosphate cotransporter [Euwallacea fornicatus]|uniref:putative inorganic phosphate cotransporter n=1 Tax=Euwallacea fornicatus TaxID=995702 RepID=UPI00338EAFAF